MRKPSGVVIQAWSGRLLFTGLHRNPGGLPLGDDSWTFCTVKPTWFTTDPSVPPVEGAGSRRCSITMTPGNRTSSKNPALTAVPPIATKIFLLASTSRELRCQWPMVTPFSLGVKG